MFTWEDIKLKTIDSKRGYYKASFESFELVAFSSRWMNRIWWELKLRIKDQVFNVLHNTIYPREKEFRDSIAKYLNNQPNKIIRHIFSEESQDK